MPAAVGGGGHSNPAIVLKDGVPIRYAISIRTYSALNIGICLLILLFVAYDFSAAAAKVLGAVDALVLIGVIWKIRQLLEYEKRKTGLRQLGKKIQAEISIIHGWPKTIFGTPKPSCYIELDWNDPSSHDKHIFLSEGFYYDPIRQPRAGDKATVLVDEKNRERYWIDISPWAVKP